VGVERVSGGDEPRIVLAQPARRPALPQRTSPGLRQVQAVNGKPSK
jgi:hypothetical protein